MGAGVFLPLPSDFRNSLPRFIFRNPRPTALQRNPLITRQVPEALAGPRYHGRKCRPSSRGERPDPLIAGQGPKTPHEAQVARAEEASFLRLFSRHGSRVPFFKTSPRGHPLRPVNNATGSPYSYGAQVLWARDFPPALLPSAGIFPFSSLPLSSLFLPRQVSFQLKTGELEPRGPLGLRIPPPQIGPVAFVRLGGDAYGVLARFARFSCFARFAEKVARDVVRGRRFESPR